LHLRCTTTWPSSFSGPVDYDDLVIEDLVDHEDQLRAVLLRDDPSASHAQLHLYGGGAAISTQPYGNRSDRHQFVLPARHARSQQAVVEVQDLPLALAIEGWRDETMPALEHNRGGAAEAPADCVGDQQRMLELFLAGKAAVEVGDEPDQPAAALALSHGDGRQVGAENAHERGFRRIDRKV